MLGAERYERDQKMKEEKKLEKELAKRVDGAGGWCIKLLSTYIKGLPDRMCLMPKGRIAFAEIKTKGRKPKPMQSYVHKRLKGLGFQCEVIDDLETLNTFCDGLSIRY